MKKIVIHLLLLFFAVAEVCAQIDIQELPPRKLATQMAVRADVWLPTIDIKALIAEDDSLKAVARTATQTSPPPRVSFWQASGHQL